MRHPVHSRPKGGHSLTGGRSQVCLGSLATALLLFAAPLSANPVQPQAMLVSQAKGRETGLPVPRFVSLRSREARMRVGPSTDYGTEWIYKVAGLPFEITAEYGNWRQVRDSDGISGWMHRALLSSKRTALIGPWIASPVALRTEPASSARALAMLGARVRLGIHSCDGAWCNVEVTNHQVDGFVRQSALWGVYPTETIK